jgi:hypothetical protein
MKRVFALLAIAGLSAAVGACSDDDGGDDDKDTPKDAGPDASKDAGKDASGPRGQQIATESLGDACGATSDCSGAGTLQCLKALQTVPTVPGGFCTAECTATSECGSGGACPTGDALAHPAIAGMSAEVKAGLTALLPPICLQKCTVGDAGGKGTCDRAGYVCASIITILPPGPAQQQFGGLSGLVQTFKDTYCLPGGAPTDAGTSALILGGIDSGL